MNFPNLLSAALAPAAVCAGGTVGAADPAKDYPNRPLRLIMPNAPGSSADTLGRIAAAKLGDALGQQIVVDNRAGAGGVVGLEIGKNAAPDGYTLITTSAGALTVSPHIRRNLPYDPLKDFESVVVPYKGGGPSMAGVLATPEMKELLARQGAEAAIATPGEFRQAIAEEIVEKGKLVKAIGLKGE